MVSEQKRVKKAASGKLCRAVAPQSNYTAKATVSGGRSSMKTKRVGLFDNVKPYVAATPEERVAAALPVMRRARTLVAKAWQRNPTFYAPPSPGEAWSLIDALRDAADGGPGGEYARVILLKYVGPNLADWNDHPRRIQREVLDLLDRAIVDCGGEPIRRGGWVVR